LFASRVSYRLRPLDCLSSSAFRRRVASSSSCAASHSSLRSIGTSVVPPDTNPEDMAAYGGGRGNSFLYAEFWVRDGAKWWGLVAFPGVVWQGQPGPNRDVHNCGSSCQDLFPVRLLTDCAIDWRASIATTYDMEGLGSSVILLLFPPFRHLRRFVICHRYG
jgi:hypothetical protein